MNILFVSGYDSMNYTLAECAREAIKRGHRVLVVVRDAADQGNNYMYERRGIQVTPLDSFDIGFLDTVDIVITSPVKPQYYKEIFEEIHDRNLFTVSFATLFSSIVMREYPDIVFCLGEGKIDEFRENGLEYRCVLSGNPQYDVLIDHSREKVRDEDIKRVLIVDQGGYPYGAKGKMQLAETLKSIASNDPGRIYEIKQRYNGKRVFSTTHTISENLCDFLTEMPENLHFLQADLELEEILPEYDAMITTWSTSYLDAIVMNIPMVLISGFDSVDRFDVRNQRVDDAYKKLTASGCVRDYHELKNERITFSYANETFRDYMLYKADAKSAPDILDVIELIHEKIISRGLRINQVFQVDCMSFLESIDEFETVRVNDSKYALKKRFLIDFNDKMQEWVYQNRCMGNVLDLSSLTEFYRIEIKDADDLNRMLEKAENEFQKIRDVFFEESELKSILASDRILQDFYFDWLCEREKHSLLKNPEVEILAPESRYFNLCLYELDHGCVDLGMKYLDSFLNTIYLDNRGDLLKHKRFAQCMLQVLKKSGFKNFAFFVIKGGHIRMLEYFDRSLVTDYAVMSLLLMYTFFKQERFEECLEIYELHRGKKVFRKQKKCSAIEKVMEKIAGILISRVNKRNIKAMKRKEKDNLNNR